jgi:hypothetical protein
MPLALRAADQSVAGIKPIALNVPARGHLSFGIYDGSGTLIRSLAYAKEVDGGPLTLTWDGTTDLGLPVAAGNYRAKGVFFSDGPKAKYVMKVGISGDPPWVQADGSGGWGGNLGSPMDVCSNGTDIVAAFQCVEDNLNTGVQRMDPAGKITGRYHTFFGWDIRLAVAMDREHLFLALTTLGAKRLIIAKYDINNPRGKILADIPAGEHVEAGGRWKGRWTTDVRGIALLGDRLFVPVLLDDKLFIVDANSGKMLKSAAIASPRGVSSRGENVFALSGKKLLRLDQDGNTAAIVIDSGLDDPSGVAIDAEGNFYITDRGLAQQVKVFSPDGRLLRTIGKSGGRPRNGVYDAAGLLDPRGICVAADGNVWVTSSAEDFQRISVWDAKNGALKREFFSTRISAEQGKLSPDRKEMIFTNDVYADVPGVSAYSVDFEHGTWKPAWHQDMPIDVMHHDEVLLGNTHIYDQLATSFAGRAPYLSFAGGMMKADNGKTYLTGGDFSIWLFDPETKQPKLASLIYTHRVHKLPDGHFEGDYDQGPNSWLTWSDVKGDGRMSLAGARFTENPPALEKTHRLFGWELQPDLSILMLCPIDRPKQPTAWTVFRLPPRQVLSDGVPIYDWSDLKEQTALAVPSFSGGDGWKGGQDVTLMDFNSSCGAYDIFAEPHLANRVNLRLPGIDGDGWWASRNWRNSPMRFDTAGRPAWLKLGRRAPGKAQPGEMYYPRNISTDIDGFCFIDDTFAQTWVWTDTGLYVGRLYHEQWEQIRDSSGVFIESTASYAYKINGKVYACIGDHGVWVHELTLPQLTPIDGGAITLTPAQASSAKPWDPDGPAPGKRPFYVAHTIWDFAAEQESRRKPGNSPGDFHLRHITIDGKLDDGEWGGIEPMEIKADGKTVARVKVLFDKTTLYLAYDVDDPSALKNAGTELPYSPFTSGSYVDFCIGRDWTNPDRQENLEGDVRVILARITGAGGKTSDYQMGFYPVRKRFAKNPQTITSPAATRHFDDISPLPGLKWAYQLNDHGYTLEASVPMEPGQTLDLHPAQNIGFDVSIGFANLAGTVRQRAAHWAGESEAMVVDRPGAAALRPATWGTLVFDRSVRPAK